MARVRDIRLDADGIDEASEVASDFLKGAGLTDREVMAARIAFEDALLRLRDHLGDGVAARMSVSKLLSRPRLIVTVEGERFDPLAAEAALDEEYVRIGGSALAASGLSQTYSYRVGTNVLTLTRPRRPLSSIRQILLAFVLGLAVAFVGSQVLDEGARSYLLESLLNPLFNLYLDILGGLAGPLVFLSVAWGVCGIGDAAMLGRSGKALAKGFLLGDLMATVLALVVCVPLFGLPMQAGASSASLFSDLVELVVGLIPTNIVAPFLEGNTSQIIVLGLIIGVASLILRRESTTVRTAIGELNSLAQLLMEQFCRFIALFIFLMVVIEIWSGTFLTLLRAWKPLLLSAALALLCTAVRIGLTCLRRHVGVRTMLRALRPPMLMALTTCSSSASLSLMGAACTDDLGVSQEQTSFGIPLGVVLEQMSYSSMLVVLMLYCAKVYGVGADPSWYLRLAVTCFLYAIVAPPVPGGMLVCYSLMFAELGIPSDALVLVTALDVILDYLNTSLHVGTIVTVVFDAASGLGAVDRTALEA